MKTPMQQLPEGLLARPIRYDADARLLEAELDVLYDLIARCDVAVINEVDTTRDDVHGMLMGSSTDRGASLVVERGLDVVGLLWLEPDPTGCETWMDVYVDPTHGNAAEVRRFCIAAGLRAANIHRGSAAQWMVRTGAFAQDEGMTTAFDEAGFTFVRRMWRMHIDLNNPLVAVEVPPLPELVTIVAEQDEAGRRIVYELEQEAFAEHWGAVRRSWQEWHEHMTSGVAPDENGWWVLRVDGRPAGVCVLDDSRAELGDGYVRLLGVLSEFRARGFGTLLLQRAFAHYRELGRRGVQLGVDSTNTTGATALYESVGMRATRTIDIVERALP